MGWGDELMALGEAQHLARERGKRVRILDRNKKPRWHVLWENCRDICGPGDGGDVDKIINGPGARPYIQEKTNDRWWWRQYAPRPARLYFNEQTRRLASAADLERYVIVEPNLKAKASPNKDWGWERWLQFATLATDQGIKLAQFAAGGAERLLPGVRHVASADFKLACAMLGNARAYVGHEGGLHHAAAAVGVPAVVIFGGFISPAQTGYPGHRNLFTGGKPCGMRVACQHCDTAMAAITPAQVLDELKGILHEADRRSVAA